MAKVSRVHNHHHHNAAHRKDSKKKSGLVVKGSQVSQSHAASNEKIGKLAEFILRAKDWASAETVKYIITKYGEVKLDRMLMASENIAKLSDDMGLSKRDIFKMAKYIETKLQYKVKKGKAYLHKNKTGLARTIEYKSRRAFIHLKTHDVLPLGQGCHKKVTRSIMYAAHSPELVANCVGDKTVRREGRVLKKLHNKPGIATTYAVSEHRKKSGKKVYSIITKLYNAHTVRSYEYNRSHMENRGEAVYIARDLMLGLESMHAKKLAHRDLHSGNFMVHREEVADTVSTDTSATDATTTKVSAALIDFGQVVSFHKAKKMVPQIEVSKHLVTPEALIKGKHRVDVRKIESYAVGCSLYHLFFGSGPEWCEKMKRFNVKKMGKKHRKSLSHDLARDIRATINKRRSELSAGGIENVKLGRVILKLLDPNPEKRFSPKKAREMLDQVIARLEAK